ncbi:copper transport protein ATOX1-like [Mya arenaria]|uniref:copper transport protein ATOX1-like n=1 Tax=Mya arenaria TaxID=6604 RepID=UPI0022E2292C|nr:copper transport protein ATOX1-like [Mya arenaria]
MSAQKYVFDMEMTCGGCTNAARKVLEKIGVNKDDIDANLDAKTVTVTSTLSSDELLAALQKTGKNITLRV